MGNTLEAILEVMQGRTQAAKTKAREASASQIAYYETLCKTAKETPMKGLNSVTISSEIARLKTEVVNNATPNQKKALIENKEVLGLTLESIDTMNFNTASKYLEEASKLVLATDAQMNRIIDCVRFGLVPVIPSKLTKYMASKIIASYEEKLKAFSDFITLPQVMKIRTCQEKLGDAMMDIKDLSALSKVQASELIVQLLAEIEALKEVKAEQWESDIEPQYTEELEESGKDRGLRKTTVEDMHGATRLKLWKLIHSEILGQVPESYTEFKLITMIEFVKEFAKDELEAMIEELID